MTEIDGKTGQPHSTTTLQVMYIMHAISPFTFWTLSLIAVIIGAFTRDSVRGTYLETHYSWLLKTFLYGIVFLIGVTVILFLSIVGILLLWLAWGILTIWYLWRVIRGWLRLNDGRPAPG